MQKELDRLNKDLKARNASVATVVPVRVSTMLSVLIVGNFKVKYLGIQHW